MDEVLPARSAHHRNTIDECFLQIDHYFLRLDFERSLRPYRNESVIRLLARVDRPLRSFALTKQVIISDEELISRVIFNSLDFYPHLNEYLIPFKIGERRKPDSYGDFKSLVIAYNSFKDPNGETLPVLSKSNSKSNTSKYYLQTYTGKSTLSFGVCDGANLNYSSSIADESYSTSSVEESIIAQVSDADIISNAYLFPSGGTTLVDDKIAEEANIADSGYSSLISSYQCTLLTERQPSIQLYQI